jgi:hypothetical protein
MDNRYKDLLDKVDNLMIALCKQKHLNGFDPVLINALKDITKSRNHYKRQLNESAPAAVILPAALRKPKVKKDYGMFLDELTKRVI